MFKGFQKSKITFNPDKKIEDKISADFVTHNMPESNRFSGQTFSDTKITSSNKSVIIPEVASHHKIGFLIIGGGLVLVAVLLYFGYSYFVKPLLNPTEVPVVNINTIENNEITTTTNLKNEDSETISDSIISDAPIIATSTPVTPSSTEPILAEERPVVLETVKVSTVDSDADGLTDDEERIVGTDPNKADTDDDGYLDLAELKSGYDPLVPNQKISENSSMLSYQIDQEASIIYPLTWDISKSEANNTIIFADSDKAFIQVFYQDNPEKLAPNLWFGQQFSGVTPGESVSGQTWQGVYSSDGLAAYIFNKDFSKIYNFSCSPLTSDTSSVTLFHLMIKTLVIK